MQYRCGIMVHEYCYTPSNESAGEANHADHQSMSSSASTEPWFCEPCLFGDGTMPHCELCPSRFGAFKKAGIILKIYGQYEIYQINS
jgi:hypothetical protein